MLPRNPIQKPGTEVVSGFLLFLLPKKRKAGTHKLNQYITKQLFFSKHTRAHAAPEPCPHE
jgi:hypothetical protein